METSAGFNTLELLVTIVIISIIGTISINQYQHYLAKSFRQQCRISMSQITQKIENYYQQHYHYKGLTLSELNRKQPERYQLDLQTSDQSYLLKATPSQAQNKYDIDCGIITINQQHQWSFLGSAKIEQCL